MRRWVDEVGSVFVITAISKKTKRKKMPMIETGTMLEARLDLGRISKGVPDARHVLGSTDH
jgi:hypothetical protein